MAEGLTYSCFSSFKIVILTHVYSRKLENLLNLEVIWYRAVYDKVSWFLYSTTAEPWLGLFFSFFVYTKWFITQCDLELIHSQIYGLFRGNFSDNKKNFIAKFVENCPAQFCWIKVGEEFYKDSMESNILAKWPI